MEGMSVPYLVGAFVAAMGIPSGLCSFFFWWLKRDIEKRERARERRDENIEKTILMMMQTGRANNVLATATAKAVQRIPEAKCNGDMKAALKEARRIQMEEKDFLLDNGIKHIFGE